MAIVRLSCCVAVAFLLTGLLWVGHSAQPYGIAMSFGYYAQRPWPGGSIILDLGIQNAGSAQEKIVRMNVSVDFVGQLPVPTLLPVTLQPGERRDFQIPVQVPASAGVEGYLAKASVAYEYLDPASQQWTLPPDSPWVSSYPVGLVKSPSMVFGDAFTILGGIGLVSGAIPIATAVFARKHKTSFAFVGRGLGLIGGTFGLLVSPLTLITSGQISLSQIIFSASVFACSILGLFGMSSRPRTWIRGLAMLGGAISLLLVWWYGFSLSAALSNDSGAQYFLSSTMFYFWWIALVIVGGLMMIVSWSHDIGHGRAGQTMELGGAQS